MEDVLRSRGLFRITSRKETKPTDDEKKIKWANRCDCNVPDPPNGEEDATIHQTSGKLAP